MKRNYYLKMALGLVFSVGAFAQSGFDCSSLDPIVESTEINICEPGGKVVLEAQINTGNEIFWYDSADSKADPIETGTSFDIGNVTSNISYWVTEGQTEMMTLKEQVRKNFPKETESTNNKGMRFDAFKEFTIKEVDVFALGEGGDITIELKQDLAVIESIKIVIPDASKTKIGILQTVPLDFKVPGEGSYTLGIKGNVTLRKEYLKAEDFPMPIADVGEVTGGTGTGFNVDPKWFSTYFWFYNWTIEVEGIYCESEPRKEIKVNINDDYPEVPEIDTTYVLCGDADFTLEDIAVDANNPQWFNENFEELEYNTLIEVGITYHLADKSIGGCLSEYAKVAFTILDISELPIADAEQSFEEESGDTLASLEVEGENLRWYADANKEKELSENTELEDAITYYVTQTLENHCESETIGITVSKTLGVNNIAFEGLVYTNPVKDILYLSNNETIDGAILYDLTGKKLSLAISENTFTQTEINLSYLTPGTYLLDLKVNGTNKTIRIVKR